MHMHTKFLRCYTPFQKQQKLTLIDLDSKMTLSMYCTLIIQLYFERKVSYRYIAKVLKTEGMVVPPKTIWKTIQKYKTHGMFTHLPGSGRPFMLNSDILRVVEDQMNDEDDTTATQLEDLRRKGIPYFCENSY